MKDVSWTAAMMYIFCSDLSATRTKVIFPYGYKFGSTFDKVGILAVVHPIPVKEALVF